MKKKQQIETIWVWREFGESSKNLQTYSILIPLFPKKMFKITIKGKHTEQNRNDLSLGWVWRIPKSTPNSLPFSQKSKINRKEQKNRKIWKHMSLERVWGEFGESLENPQAHSKIACFFWTKMKKTMKGKHNKTWNHLSLDRVWSEFGESPNSLQTHSSFPKKVK